MIHSEKSIANNPNAGKIENVMSTHLAKASNEILQTEEPHSLGSTSKTLSEKEINATILELA